MLDRLKLCFILIPILAMIALELPVLAGNEPVMAKADAKPTIEVPERKADVGVVQMNQTIFHEFLIRNQGPGELSILEVGTGCGCAQADYDRKIAPGREGRIGLTVEVSEANADGSFSQRAVVKTNAANLKLFILEITGSVEKR